LGGKLIAVANAPVFAPMSANSQELFTADASFGKSLNVNSAYRSERRKRVRTKVHWAILLFREDSGEAVETITRDLSSTGFYCLSHLQFACGEVVICSLQIPTYEPSNTEGKLALECKAKVVRIEPGAAKGLCGIACQIEDYRLAIPLVT
jgi:PilZ domain-containing protein